MAEEDSEKPKIRPLEAIPSKQDDKPVFILRDPFHYSDAMLTLSPMGALILQLLDGTNTLLDIQTVLSRRANEIFPSDKIREILKVLDECYFLDNDRFMRRKDEIEKAFADSGVRPSPMAGRSYPADASELRAFMDQLFGHPEAGRLIPGDMSCANGVISPHIDFARGGVTYVPAYRALAKSTAETFIILAVSHTGGLTPLIPTRKDFATPFGLAETDRELLTRVEGKLAGRPGWENIYAGEFAHAHEHSAEFQVVFLQYLFGGVRSRPFRVLPILCGFSHEEVQEEQRAGGGPIRSFLNALLESVSESGRKVAYVAGVDFAHVGAQFGDSFAVDESKLTFLRERDEQMMAFLSAGDPEEFHKFICEESNSRRVCGYPALYSFLSILPRASRDEGRVLKYGQWPDPNGTVTFGSLSFG